jgi:hypothetical protein
MLFAFGLFFSADTSLGASEPVICFVFGFRITILCHAKGKSHDGSKIKLGCIMILMIKFEKNVESKPQLNKF